MHTSENPKLVETRRLVSKDLLYTLPAIILFVYICYLLSLNNTCTENQKNGETISVSVPEFGEPSQDIETALINSRVDLMISGNMSVSQSTGTLVKINEKLYVITALHSARILMTSANHSIRSIMSDEAFLERGSGITYDKTDDATVTIRTNNGITATLSENITIRCEFGSTGIAVRNPHPEFTDENGHSIDGICAISVTEDTEGYLDLLNSDPIDLTGINSISRLPGTVAMYANQEGGVSTFEVGDVRANGNIVVLNHSEQANVSRVCPMDSGSFITSEDSLQPLGIMVIANANETDKPEGIEENGCWPGGFAFIPKELFTNLSTR